MNSDEWVHYTVHNAVKDQRDKMADSLREFAKMDCGEYVDAHLINKARDALKTMESE